MAESEIRRKPQKAKLFSDSEMDAARQLMQLSDEDDVSVNENEEQKKKRKGNFDLGRQCEKSQGDDDHEVSNRLIIEQVFGKGDEVISYHPKQKKKYRSLAGIYAATKPILETS